jgi:predicted transcriptional regulator
MADDILSKYESYKSKLALWERRIMELEAKKKALEGQRDTLMADLQKNHEISSVEELEKVVQGLIDEVSVSVGEVEEALKGVSL